MSRLREQVREAVRTRHDSLRAEEAYLRWVRRYILFCGKRHPAELGAREVSAFISHLAVDRRVAASTQTQALSALLFLYREVLTLPIGWVDDVGRAKKPKRLPVAFTREEARAVLQKAVKRAIRAAGVAKPGSCHTFRHPHDRGGLRHPHRAGVARTCECRDHTDLHARPQPRRARREKPPRCGLKELTVAPYNHSP